MLYTLPFPQAVPMSHQPTLNKRFTDPITYTWRCTNPDPTLARTASLAVVLADNRRVGIGASVSVPPSGTVDVSRNWNVTNFQSFWVPGVNTHTLVFAEALPGGGVADFATHMYTVNAVPLVLALSFANGVRGATVSIPVFFEGSTESILAFEIRFAYNGTIIPTGVGVRGVSLPTSWFFGYNQPAPGDLRVVAVDFSGTGNVFGFGEIVRLDLSIAGGAPLGPIPISVSSSDFRNTTSVLIPTRGIDGAVTVVL